MNVEILDELTNVQLYELMNIKYLVIEYFTIVKTNRKLRKDSGSILIIQKSEQKSKNHTPSSIHHPYPLEVRFC